MVIFMVLWLTWSCQCSPQGWAVLLQWDTALSLLPWALGVPRVLCPWRFPVRAVGW